jgi:large subunit ribosomal protein L15
MPLQRRLPRLKGSARGPRGPARPKVYAPVNVGQLGDLEGDTFGPDELRAAGLIAKKKGLLVKVLGQGEISRAVAVQAHGFSGSAKEKIEAAGGSVEVLEA